MTGIVSDSLILLNNVQQNIKDIQPNLQHSAFCHLQHWHMAHATVPDMYGNKKHLEGKNDRKQ